MSESDRDKTLEVMARAACQRTCRPHLQKGNCWCIRWRGEREKDMEAALTALEASGRAVVPREPTQAMAKAGYEACRDIPRTGVVPEDIERTYDCWQAMVAAADGKAPAPQASAEAQSAVANSPMKEKKDG